ncbi:MAG: MerR family DNA-binding transcriptional regulator [Alphaproteobacteria bacterium]|nr:MerR family DNA-binding transcriptional regulator [Alphaproteobacteria bacterium]
MAGERDANRASRAWFSTHQVATLFGVSIATVVNWEKRGLLDARRTPGGHRRIALDEVVRFARDSDQPLPPELAAHAPTAPREDGPRRVLVVHQNHSFGELIRDYLGLEDEAVEVKLVHRGLGAGHALAGWRPHLVLLDLSASEVPVRLFLELARLQDPAPRVVGLRGLGSRPDAAEGELDGVQEHATSVEAIVKGALAYLDPD